MTKKKPRICIVAHNAYGAMTGGRHGHVGGAEHQTSLMARWFASKGYEVSLLTWDEGQPPEMEISGVRMLKMCPADAGIRGLRFFYPRLISLYAALRKADADVYYHNSAEYVTGLLAIWCRFHKKKLIYSVASDVACDPELPAMDKSYEKILYRYGLRHADRIIVQTARQQSMLEKGFGVQPVPLPMPCPGPSSSEYNGAHPPNPKRVVWVGRVASMKRLEWFLDIAECLPELQFDIAAANLNATSYAQGLYTRAKTAKNVVWHGAVSREQMPTLYENALCLCCTSTYEGFPNTFLEAWSHGRPVITSFDPDNLIKRFNLGAAAHDIPSLAKAILSLVNHEDQWHEKSRNSIRYYLENHQVEISMPLFEKEFIKVLPISNEDCQESNKADSINHSAY